MRGRRGIMRNGRRFYHAAGKTTMTKTGPGPAITTPARLRLADDTIDAVLGDYVPLRVAVLDGDGVEGGI
jgi:hypothetical protein